MKTVIIGGGKGCRAILDLARSSFLKELTLDIVCVVDVDINARGMQRARDLGIPTTTDIKAAISAPEVELVIELTGNDSVLENLYRVLPPGMRVVDHTFARIFWDLVNAREEQERRLKEITELEREVESEKFFLQSLFDTIPELVAVLDTDKRVTKINDSMSRYTRVPRQKATGQLCSGLFSKTELAELCEDTQSLIDDVLETGRPRSLIRRLTEPEEAFWEVTFTPVLNQDLEIAAVVGTWHRITEQVQLYRKIETAEQRFKQFINSAHDWISIKDLDGRYVIVNPVCAEAFHRHPDDFIGSKPEELLDMTTAEMIKKHDREVIATNRHHTYDEVFQVDGRNRHYHTIRFPLSDYTGKTVGVCTISRDVTEERELRDQLVQTTRLAAIGKLAAGVAHEINNPLTGVLAYAEDMLDELPDNSDLHRDMNVIIRETMRCRSIVRNLLDFARQEKLNLEQSHPDDIVRQVLSLVHKLPQFRNIAIDTRLEADIPEIKCDRQQLQQVILNLLMNACDAMDGQGQVILETTFNLSENECHISVADDGPGIPENIADKIFEPFFSTKGTNGLGLAVSWGIIERHRGRIEVDDSEFGGAVFTIVLPAVI